MKWNVSQQAALNLCAGPAKHILLYGGSRSGKTFLHTRNVILRAIKAPESRHTILRYRFNACKTAILLDTLPKVMKTCFDGVKYHVNKTDWYVEVNNSEIWIGGLDDKERTDKILGKEYATMYFNEASEMEYPSVETALTRLAQQTKSIVTGREVKPLRARAYYDCNPPSKAHWLYKRFIEGRDHNTRLPLADAGNWVWAKLNPGDNSDNLTADYLQTLEAMSTRARKRFLEGEFAEATPNQLFPEEVIDRNRVTDGVVPDLLRVVVAVDPSGASDEEAAMNDAIGIIVAGLGIDGNAYVLEDITVKASPAVWGRVAVTAFDRHRADCVVAEQNFGGAMVEHVIKTHKPGVPYKQVTASRGKAVRAEPISALYEKGQVRHVGRFLDLEDELAAFSTFGYTGERSPNRADALIWAISELFPGVVSGPRQPALKQDYSWIR